MMRDYDINELKCFEESGKGDTSTVYKVIAGKTPYAFKKFNEPDKILSSNTIIKLRNILDLKINKIITPLHLVKEDNSYIGYITFFRKAEPLSLLHEHSIKEKVRMLRECRDSIELMHNLGIIHCNLNEHTIFFNSCNITDFDHSFYKGIKPDLDFLSSDSKKYIEKYGFTKDLDIYLFNKITYEMLDLNGNNSYYSHLFNMNDYNEISKSVINPYENKESRYLIDTTQAYQKVKIY